jgi:hypothetical protein
MAFAKELTRVNRCVNSIVKGIPFDYLEKVNYEIYWTY